VSLHVRRRLPHLQTRARLSGFLYARRVCGIAGKVARGAPVDHGLIKRMCDVVRHRGPDSQGTFVEDGVGIGVQRLAVIDLDTGDQPVYNEDGTVVVALNGEIYNYRELRDRLSRSGHRFRTRTDTEVIVHLYEDHGEACVEHLRGMFAFALWDRSRRSLLLARDRVGKKPLFYAHRDGVLWFGSEAKSLLQDPELPRAVDAAAIDCFLGLGYVPQPLSAFAGLRKLPPAHTLRYQDGRVTTRRYWKLSYAGAALTRDTEEVCEELREKLLEATRLRLRSDVPLGAFLSGGVDSSAVVAAMAREATGRVKTFSIGFDVGAFDETAYAREVSKLLDTEHHEFRVTAEAIEILPKLVWHYGEPFADPSAIPTFHLSELARRHVTVALNGDGGDESFAGYERYVTHSVVARLPRLALIPASVRAALEQPKPRPAPLRKLAWLGHVLPLPAPYRYARAMALVGASLRSRLYTPEFQAEVGGQDRPSNAIAQAFCSPEAGESLVSRLLNTDVQTYLPDDLLVKMDIATMAHSLEVRSPFLDHVVMEFAASLPPTLKLHRLTTKRILKDALRPWLPDRILNRPKMGFDVPVGAWFRGPLRELPAEVLLDARATERGIFRPAELRRLIDAHRSGAEEHGKRLWALLQLELWLRTYLDGEVSGPLSLQAPRSAQGVAAPPSGH
jgi:asparagine synthase (glutamine-hydrolysing)